MSNKIKMIATDVFYDGAKLVKPGEEFEVAPGDLPRAEKNGNLKADSEKAKEFLANLGNRAKGVKKKAPHADKMKPAPVENKSDKKSKDESLA